MPVTSSMPYCSARAVGAMHLEYILRQIEPDCDNCRQDRSPTWIVANPPWDIDAVGGRSYHHRLRKVSRCYLGAIRKCEYCSLQ